MADYKQLKYRRLPPLTNHIIPTIDIFVLAALANKNMGTIFRIVFLALSGFAVGGAFAQQVPSKQVPSHKMEGLKGPVKKVTNQWGRYYLSGDTLAVRKEIGEVSAYSPSGMITMYIKPPTESDSYTTYFYYNSLDQLIKEITYDDMFADSSASEVNSITTNQYDKYNRLVSSLYISDDEMEGDDEPRSPDTVYVIYTYNDNNLTLTTLSYYGNSTEPDKLVQQFDKRGNVIESYKLEGDKKLYRRQMIHNELIDGWTTTVVYYDSDNKKTNTVYHKYNCDSVQTEYCGYNKDGRFTSQMLTWWQAGYKVIDQCSYDKEGKVASRNYKRYDKYGTEVEAYERKIDYKGETYITEVLKLPTYIDGLLTNETKIVDGKWVYDLCYYYDTYGNVLFIEAATVNTKGNNAPEQGQFVGREWKYEYY